MKKFFTIIALFFLAVPVFAEDNPVAQGNFVVSLPLFQYFTRSGDLYENAEGDGSTYYSIGVTGYETSVQIFVIDGLAVGGIFGYEKAEQGEVYEKSIFLGPLVNYYFNLGKILPYVGAGLFYEKYEEGDGSDTYKATLTSIHLQGGISFMLGKNLALYGQVYYDIDSGKYELNSYSSDTEDGNEIGIDIGFKGFF